MHGEEENRRNLTKFFGGGEEQTNIILGRIKCKKLKKDKIILTGIEWWRQLIYEEA